MFVKRLLKNTIPLSLLLVALFGCEQEQSRGKMYLENAKDVAVEKDWTEVISQLQKFVAIEDQASIVEKKEAWILLAEATASLGQIRESAEILELMIQDVDYDVQTRVEVYNKLVRLYDRSQNWEKAADTRVKLIQYRKMDNDEVAHLLLQAGLNYQNIKKYRESDEIFNSALEKAENSGLRAELYYYKAYGKTVFNEMDIAEEYLQEALKSDVIAEEIEGQIYYLIGDILEWRKLYAKAYANYKKALNLYPNKMFVQKRIDFLEKNHGRYLKTKDDEANIENDKK